MPFIFARVKENVRASPETIECWVVIISEPVYSFRVPPPPNEPQNLLVIPENTIEDKRLEKTFSSLKQAREYVRQWWVLADSN